MESPKIEKLSYLRLCKRDISKWLQGDPWVSTLPYQRLKKDHKLRLGRIEANEFLIMPLLQTHILDKINHTLLPRLQHHKLQELDLLLQEWQVSTHKGICTWSLKLSQTIHKLNKLGKASRGERKKKRNSRVPMIEVNVLEKWKVCSLGQTCARWE